MLRKSAVWLKVLNGSGSEIENLYFLKTVQFKNYHIQFKNYHAQVKNYHVQFKIYHAQFKGSACNVYNLHSRI